jgi:nitrite reductase/ring-hydroxylating ferredoxin subunit
MADSMNLELNRRNFVVAAAAATAGMGMMGACGGLQQADAQDAPPPAAPPASQPAAGPLDVGVKGDYAKDGATMTWVKTHHVIVMREEGKIYAMTSRCTHKRCDLSDATTGLHCKCHNSDFNYDGTVIKGPATKGGPLVRYGIAANDAGHLIVDPSKQFPQDQWTDAASFVTVDAGA